MSFLQKQSYFVFKNLHFSKRQQSKLISNFVPKCKPVCQSDVELLQRFIDNSKSLFVMTGAGISTESGIPDYRSEVVGLYASRAYRPLQYREFIESDKNRQRYWARSYIRWPQFSSLSPNISHKILSEWEHKGKIHWLVTQNLDSLHDKAGSRNVTELHGSSYRVMCISCNFKIQRSQLQIILAELNSSWYSALEDVIPGGHVQLTEEQIKGFKFPVCFKCGGHLKPEIVFFGEDVLEDKVDFVFARLEESDAVLVIGSSLEVCSGYRFVNEAFEKKKPIGLLNIGHTKADNLANIKINAKCSEVLMKIIV